MTKLTQLVYFLLSVLFYSYGAFSFGCGFFDDVDSWMTTGLLALLVGGLFDLIRHCRQRL